MSSTKRQLKKEMRAQFADKLKSLFKEFEPQMGARKFNRKIKKASKIFAANIKPLKRDQVHRVAPVNLDVMEVEVGERSANDVVLLTK